MSSVTPQGSIGKRWQEAATSLHKIGAIQFGKFDLASGRSSPYYIDLRLAYSHPRVFNTLSDMCVDVIKREMDESTNKFAGVPISGLSLATLVSYKLNLPLILVREKRKMHGQMKRVEGLLEQGDHVVVVDDLATTGGSIRDVADAIRDEGGIVKHAVVILDREEGAREALAENNIHMHACMKILNVVGHLRDIALLDEKQYSLIVDYLGERSR